jgi:hypothetical protein
VYVEALAGTGSRVQVSVAGGEEPRWRADGRELFFLGTDGRMMAAGVDGSGADFEVTGVRELFAVPRLPPEGIWYDVTSDGERFLVEVIADVGQQPIRLVVNWAEDLAHR